mgnify:CR=1 FL=1
MSDSAALHAISPIDGRYRRHAEPLAAYFSEAGLIQYRIRVEVEYFIALHGLGLAQLPALTDADCAASTSPSASRMPRRSRKLRRPPTTM